MLRQSGRKSHYMKVAPPGRVEPRKVKQRKKPFKTLNRPRKVEQRIIIKKIERRKDRYAIA